MTHPADLVERVAKALWEDNDRYAISIGLRRQPSPWRDEEEENKERFREAARVALTEAGAWIVEARLSDSGTSAGTARQADARIAFKAIQVSRTEFFDYRPKE